MKAIKITSPENQAVINAGHYKVSDKDKIDWGCKLFDSSGWEHSLVSLGGMQVVTKASFAFAIWDRRSGQCVSHNYGDLTISNFPLTDVQKQQKQRNAIEAFNCLQTAPCVAHSEQHMQAGKDSEIEAWKAGYVYLQDRMNSLGRHGWAHDFDSEIEARIKTGTTKQKKPAPLAEISKLVTKGMDFASENGANSISMPDELVTIAHFIAFPDQYYIASFHNDPRKLDPAEEEIQTTRPRG